MSTWTASDYVLRGRFATHDDLAHAAAALAGVTDHAVVVATFSTRYLLPSISFAKGPDDLWEDGVMSDLRERLQQGLPGAEHQAEFVCDVVAEHLRDAGASDPHTWVFGGDLSQPGKIAVVVGAARTWPRSCDQESAHARAAQVAACVLGSRPAAFTRDTSIEGRIRHANNEADIDEDGQRPAATLGVVEALTDLVGDTLRTAVTAVYEGDSIHPHRASGLRCQAVRAVSHIPGWVPDSIMISSDVQDPVATELGGSRFEDLGQLANLCVVKRRRLLGVIDGRFMALGLPYGLDPVNHRAVGVLVMAWPESESAPVGVYEMALTRIVALSLARDHEERRADSSVHLVTSQLSLISGLRTASEDPELSGLAEDLTERRDVALVAESVTGILRGLVDFSGAASATCRLIAGAGGEPFSRYLLRLHCEGDDCALDTPEEIPLQAHAASVNAWVARHGAPVHLRNIYVDPETGAATSADLANYPGLTEITMVRSNVQTELCVPIFAERRVVGTVNIEAVSALALDKKAEIVSEYAQLIGIALLEARRRIGVETVTEAGGFLDHRHELDGGLEALASRINQDTGLGADARETYGKDLAKLRKTVYVRRLPGASEVSQGATVHQVIESAMRSVSWAEQATPLEDLLLDGEHEDVQGVLSAWLDPEAAHALRFAIGQAIHNVRRYAQAAEKLTGQPYLAMFRLARRVIGGEDNVWVAVSSATADESIESLRPQRVFREPLQNEERVSLGTYLAGEAMRRCGGSAFLRVYPPRHGMTIVEAEFSVPVSAVLVDRPAVSAVD